MAPVQSKIGKRGLTTKEKKEILKYMKEHPKLTRPAEKLHERVKIEK